MQYVVLITWIPSSKSWRDSFNAASSPVCLPAESDDWVMQESEAELAEL